jgi:hypothetical protein
MCSIDVIIIKAIFSFNELHLNISQLGITCFTTMKVTKNYKSNWYKDDNELYAMIFLSIHGKKNYNELLSLFCISNYVIVVKVLSHIITMNLHGFS